LLLFGCLAGRGVGGGPAARPLCHRLPPGSPEPTALCSFESCEKDCLLQHIRFLTFLCGFPCVFRTAIIKFRLHLHFPHFFGVEKTNAGEASQGTWAGEPAIDFHTITMRLANHTLPRLFFPSFSFPILFCGIRGFAQRHSGGWQGVGGVTMS